LNDTLAAIKIYSTQVSRLQFLVIQPISLFIKSKATSSSKEIIKLMKI